MIEQASNKHRRTIEQRTKEHRRSIILQRTLKFYKYEFKPFVVNALEKLVIMNKPESPEGDDVVASDDSLPEIVTFDEPSEPVEQKERSTLEILEEQNHKRIVEQGRRAGVSIEGSDIEILERISRKNLEKYN